MLRYLLIGACALLGIGGGARVLAQTGIDPELLAAINQIKAIDNHAHPKRPLQEGESDAGTDFADPFDPEFDVPMRLRPDNPEYGAAQQALYLSGELQNTKASTEQLAAAKKRVRDEKGEQFPAWVLDRLNIDVMFANRVAMGQGLAAPRFLWVPYADAYLFPLDNTAAGAANPDYRAQFNGATRLLQSFLREAGVAKLPGSLTEYLSKVVDPTIERQKSSGAVALKFSLAYMRTLDFDNPSERRPLAFMPVS